MPRCCNADTRLGACLRSSWSALRKASTALSQSLFCVASNPSRENLAASLASLLPCASDSCEAQSARAMIRVRAEYFFMIFCWTLAFPENSKLRQLIAGRKRKSLRLFWRRRLLDVDPWLGLRCSRFTRSRLIQPHDAQCATGRFVDLDQCPTQSHFAGSDRKRCRKIGNKPVHDRFDGAPENRIHRAAHSRVAQKRGAAGEDLFVRCLNVGVCAD